MKRYGQLFSRVVDFSALLAAAVRARRAGPLGREALAFFVDLEANLIGLRDELEASTYRPGMPRRFVIYEPKRRTITAAPFRDRVVHHALCAVLEPIFERSLTPHSFACRGGMGLHRAVDSAQRHLRRRRYALECDIRHYFETIDHERLRESLRRRIKDRRVLDLIDLFLTAGRVARGDDRAVGLPIGSLTSQHFANAFLAPTDRWILRRIRAGTYVRYMDDLLVFGDRQRELWTLEADLAEYLETAWRLELKREMSEVYRFTVGVPFLGLRIFRGTIRLGAEARRRLVRKMTRAERQLASGAIDDLTYQARIAGLMGYASAACSLSFRRSLVARRTPADRG